MFVFRIVLQSPRSVPGSGPALLFRSLMTGIVVGKISGNRILLFPLKRVKTGTLLVKLTSYK